MRSGLLAEFATPEALVAAVERLRELGYTRLDTFSPHAVLHAETPLGIRRSPVRLVALVFGLLGVAVAYVIQWWCNGVDYAVDVGGRPTNSIPSDVPICFETAVLFASLAAFFGTWALCRLPRLHHPVFEVPGFESASVDRFWVGVDAADPRFDLGVGDELSRLGALRVESFGRAAS